MASSHRYAFTLLELLVVVGIIAVLIAILIPVLSRSKEIARTTHCLSGMRQWGFAMAYYTGDYNQALPEEGSATSASSVTNYGCWYNALPPYVNAPRYCYVYAGVSSRIGTTITDENNISWTIGTLNPNNGYQNSWIWYCQTRLETAKNSASSLNSFHYCMNGMLDGIGSTGPTKDQGVTYTSLRSIPDPTSTIFMFEPTTDVASDWAPEVDVNRHNGSSNLLFIDQHVETLPAADIPASPTLLPNNMYASFNPMINWGPF